MPKKDQHIFAAIDFETADDGRDSACAVSIVRVVDYKLGGKFYGLIRPPRPPEEGIEFKWTHIHKLTWRHVKNERDFGQVWPDAEIMLEDAQFVVAHNAEFDRGVLYACCQAHGIEPPKLRWRDTMVLARNLWEIRPTKLSDVCKRLDIELDHHNERRLGR